MKNLHERLRKCAEIVGSGDELARLTKIPRSTLETYLIGKAEPRASRIAEICDVCGVSAHWLITGAGNMRQDSAPQAKISEGAALAEAIRKVEHTILILGLAISADLRAALIMLARDMIIAGEDNIIATHIGNLIRALPATNSQIQTMEEEALLLAYRNASAAKRQLMALLAAKKDSVSKVA